MVLQIHVAPTTCMTMNERFSILNALPRRGAGPRGGRRRSTSGPLNQNSLRKWNQNQELVQEVVRQLEMQWKTQEQQQRMGRSRSQGPSYGKHPRSRSGSRARSRASSVGRFGSERSLPGIHRMNSWSNLSQRSAPWRQSQGNLYGGRSRTVSFSSEPGFNLNLPKWQGWRSRGGHNQRGRVSRPHQQYQQNQNRGHGRQGQWQNQWRQNQHWPNQWRQNQWRQNHQGQNKQGQQQQWRNHQGQNPWRQNHQGQNKQSQNQQGHNQWRLNQWRANSDIGNKSTENENTGIVAQSIARSTQNVWEANNSGGTGADKGQDSARGRAGGQPGVTQSSMPGLVSLAQLDKELDEYMSGSKQALDKELEEYMAHAMDFD